MRRAAQSSSASCRGFTLLELLIVLLILASVMGLSLPALRGSLDKSRLTAAAKDVQAALARTRSLAIREASPVQFCFQPGGRRYWIERLPARVSESVIVLEEFASQSGVPESALDGVSGTVISSEPESDPATDLSGSPDLGRSKILREGLLPDGVTFAVGRLSGMQNQGVVGSDETSAMAIPEARQNFQSGGELFANSSSSWSASLVFFPSGRTRSQTLQLIGQREFVVDIHLRGLTSAAGYTAPYRPTSPQPELESADAAEQAAARGEP